MNFALRNAVRGLLLASASVGVVAFAGAANAEQCNFNIAAQPLRTGLPELGRQAGIQVLVADAASLGRMGPALKGAMNCRAALDSYLTNVNLAVVADDGRTVTLTAEPDVSGPAPQVAAPTPTPAPPQPPQREVVVVVGSQIQGAQPTDALPVTVVSERDIDTIAATSGDDLFRSIPQLGDVAFNTSRTIGSVNDARGDTASVNLRALGTGNTLVLLNGRRMVNHPGTQAENLVPVVTVNSNAIPVAGVSRVEVLLDGASAIYGADAVAGVVNTVLKTDFDGFAIDLREEMEEGVDSKEFSANFQWGQTFNDGRSNLSVFGSYLSRDPVFASERDFSANADNTYRVPESFGSTTAFRNTSTTSPWAGFETYSGDPLYVDGVRVTNASGGFHIQPDTLPGCLTTLANGLCVDDSSTRDTALRYNVNDQATIQNGVDRYNLFSTFRHQFEGGPELFTEAGVYLADSVGYRESAPMLGAVDIVVPASNYYNPFGPVGSVNRLPGFSGPAEGVDVTLVGYRPVDAGPRRFGVENLSTRILAGLRGDVGGWDWESALLYTEANTTDTTNRVSNTRFQEALSWDTPDAYNPFNGGCLSDPTAGDCTPSSRATLDYITVPVTRKNSTSLASWDAKISRPDLFTIWAGDIGMAAGVEVRRETFKDDRDPRQDGTVNFVDMISGLESNDLQGNSPSSDTNGSRNVESAWIEFAVPLISRDMGIPLAQQVELQLAARYENFDYFGSVTKPKVALSWRLNDALMVRSAWSQGFRAPNLQQQFETGLQRSNTRTDIIRCEADYRAGRIASYTTSCPDQSQSVISNRRGSLDLQPEESENLTAGIVFDATFLPPEFGELSFTADWWRIEQDGVVGIFGDDNHILLDAVLRAQGSSNPAVVRDAPSQEDIDAFAGTGIDPVGEILYVDDNYYNLDKREVEGVDIGLYYNLDDTAWGDFSLRVNAAYLDKFFQDVSTPGGVINAAIEAGVLSSDFLTVGGEGDLVRQWGRPEWRYSAALNWNKGPFAAGWFTSFVGDVEDPGIVNGSGQRWIIDSYQTHNLYVQYTVGRDTSSPTRLRLGARNLFDEEPPLADTNFGYLGDLHSPRGRSFYASIRKSF
ncbi:MAG: TonB-dependent receptor [Hyphomonadaceae bacterium]